MLSLRDFQNFRIGLNQPICFYFLIRFYQLTTNKLLRFQIRFYRFTLRRNLNLLNRDVERHSWPLTFPPSTVNAFYLYSRNLVILILQLVTDFTIFFAFDRFWINVVKLCKEHNPYRTSPGWVLFKNQSKLMTISCRYIRINLFFKWRR